MRYRKALLLTLLMLPACAQALITNTPTISPTNQFPWVPNLTVGVRGGMILGRTNWTNLSVGASAATINTALANAPSNSAVALGAGIWDLNGQATLTIPSGKTLRGSGPMSTHILSNNITIAGTAGGASKSNLTGIAGAAADYPITASNLVIRAGGIMPSVGQVITIEQDFDSPTWFDGDLGTSVVSLHDAVITNIVDATNLFINPPMPFPLTASKNPRWRIATTNSHTEFAAFESLSIEPGAVSYGANVSFSMNCWASNVLFTNISANGLYVHSSVFFQVNRVGVRKTSSGSDGYGIISDINGLNGADATPILYGVSGLFLEHSFAEQMFHGFYFAGRASASAVAYCFETNSVAPGFYFMAPGFNGSHYVGGSGVLWEGCYGNQFTADPHHGTPAKHTVWRSRLHGMTGMPVTNVTANSSVQLWTNSLGFSVVGSVIGDVWARAYTFSTNFATRAWLAAAPNSPFGYILIPGLSASATTLNDPRVAATLTCYSNHNYWAGTVTNDTSLTVGTPVVEPSLLYTNQPSWATVWPPIDPWVTNPPPSVIPAGAWYLQLLAGEGGSVNTPRGPKIRGIRLR